jgi:nitrate/TMAO reductase-like tetraheme cytochrome c subunit
VEVRRLYVNLENQPENEQPESTGNAAPAPDVPHQPANSSRRKKSANSRRIGLRVLIALRAAREKLPPILRQIRQVISRILAVLLAFAFLAVILVFCTGLYTSRSEFCRSCHIMEPYYDSWKASSHKDVPCIECHFAPGFGGKLRGKMLGLVQLAKYVTSSAGPRPAAEIPDASCLRSGCHEARLLSGREIYRGINFDHTPHLGETRRGIQLRCTSCHSQIVQGEEHMAVTLTTCFLCHFKNMPFNEDLSACTNCHQIPSKEYDLGGGVKFTHELAYKKGVDCINCHGDVIRGKGEVPRERCMVCHNREGDLARISDFKFMHQKHVSEHKIDCLDCHLKIEHSLDKERLVHFAGDCKNCHPNHHQGQIDMLQGKGSKLIPGSAGEMTVSRLGCPTCHKTKEVSPSGTVLWKASMQVCANCHTPLEVSRLQSYHKSLRSSLPAIEEAIVRVKKALESSSLAPDRIKSITNELDKIQHDMNFLKSANDIHNIHYASKLEEVLLEQISAICTELGVESPKVMISPP